MSDDMRRYEADRRPPIEVRVGASWRTGQLRAWIRRGDGWWAYVNYAVEHDRAVTATVPARQIRTDDPRGGPPEQ